MMTELSPLVLFGKKSWRWFMARLQVASKNKTFRRTYLITALLLVLVSTVYWVVLGTRLQLYNADQLSDPYLFSNWATFHGAIFPAAHTFLLKWPLFLLLGLVGVSSTSLLIATLAVVLLTVGVLVYVLYKIDRRPLVFGTLCLALSLALLLVPAQPYAGGLLPVNMAMLTTRNLEYAVYLLVLVLFVRAARFRSRSFWWGVALLAVLIASDKLFLSLSAGGALLALVGYAAVRNWSQVTFAVRWFIGSIAAAIGGSVLVLLITSLHITHITTGGASPYGMVSSVKNVALGVTYGVAGLLTNTGANPVYDNTVLTNLPKAIIPRILSLSGLAHLIAAATLVYGLVLVWRLVWPSVRDLPKRPVKPSAANLLAVALIASTVVAYGVFVATDHNYPVDARYLTIALFALAITASTVLRKQRWQRPELLVLAGCVLLIGMVAGSFAVSGTTAHQKAALATVNERNQLVVQTLKHHKVSVLVGDYWRVLPIKQLSSGSLNVMPLGTCTDPTAALTSRVWQPDLTTHSFAYLVTLDGSLTNFPNCTLPGITATYGQPNATQIIAGTVAKPKEVLLFYDRGIQKISPSAPVTTPSIAPTDLSTLVGTGCSQPTVMNIVAHQDDDLLFMSPDLLREIKAGDCVRTVFLTAGDDGQGKFYWLGRQLGSEAAYSSMLHSKAVWDQRTIRIATNEYLTVASPHDNSKVSLIFFNLPDGDLNGSGFASSGGESLSKLHSGDTSSMKTVDGQSSYTAAQLTAALASLMNTYQPAEIHTQADVPSARYPDHSDHITTGKFAEAAAVLYDQQHFGNAITIPVKQYIGYPIHGYPANVSGTELAEKEAAFLAYAQYDGGVCHTVAQCAKTPTYNAYLSREYQETPAL